MGLTSLELFAGAGGMALGLHRAGIHATALVEYAAAPCQTLRAEVAAGRLSGEVVEGDAGAIDFTRWRGVDVVVGAPPCQPYSSAGKRRGHTDSRDGWPHWLRAVEETRPAFAVSEGVGNFMSRKFAPIRLKIEQSLIATGMRYAWWSLCAANYGTPQERRRNFIVAWHSARPMQPLSTHRRWVTADTVVGEGWLHSSRNSAANPKQERMRDTRKEPAQTVGTRNSLKFRRDDGTERMVSWREIAALQGFPPNWRFHAPTGRDGHKQAGNAVPPLLAEAIGREIVRAAG